MHKFPPQEEAKCLSGTVNITSSAILNMNRQQYAAGIYPCREMSSAHIATTDKQTYTVTNVDNIKL